MNRSDEMFLKIQEHALTVRESYRQNERKDKINVLNMGKPGTGKTRLAMFCPKPVHVDCFDRGGTKTAELQPFIESGAIIVDSTYQRDSWKNPQAFKKWEKDFRMRMSIGYYDALGTWMLDSTSSYETSLMYDVLRLGGDKRGSRVGQHPELQDYGTVQMKMVDYFSQLMECKCNVVVNGHVTVTIIDKTDELGIITEGVETSILLAGKGRDKIPLLFDEKYISRCMGKDKYVLQTSSDGKWHAETRIGGGGIFKMHEEQNLYKLLAKAGYPNGDKPLLTTNT